jgi:protein phosphatase 2C family protein 2/3
MNHQALNWPKCSFFAVYDGHGGSLCADFLRDSLHNYIIKNPNFPENVKLAIDEGFEKAEKEFIETYSLNPLKTELIDKSGSCALILLIVDDICYIANVGDSRAIVSKNCGKEFNALTIDHKPNDENETKRILENGGRVYQYYSLTIELRHSVKTKLQGSVQIINLL